MGRKKLSGEDWLLKRIVLVNDCERLIASGSTLSAFGKLVVREFRTFEAEYARVMRMREFESEYRELQRHFRSIIYKMTGNAYNTLVDFIGLPSSKSGLRVQLENLRDDARSLRELARLAERASRLPPMLSARMPEYLYVTLRANGTLEVIRSGIVQRISREGIVASRVRSCPAPDCQKLFWMKTARSKTCGEKKCSDQVDYLTNKKGK